jgi:hypothetical protein
MQIQGRRVVYWLEGEAQQNFGDFLTEYLADSLIQRMLGSADSYRLVGSAICDAIIRDDLDAAHAGASGKIAFWGCGARDERPLSPEYLAKAEFYGVRGPLTRQLLGLPADVTLGDPAFLLPLFHARKSSPHTTGKRICVPHFLDRKDDEAIRAETGADLVLRPSVANSLDALKAILDDIASADFVLAGSLHAAIVACVYDRPFAYYDAGHVDIPFKWRDFAASIGVSPLYVGTVADGQSIYEQFLKNRIVKPALFPLLAGAPFVAKLPMLLAAARHDAGAPMNDQTFATLTRSLDQLLDRYALAEALGAEATRERGRADALAAELAAARQEGETLRSALTQAEATTRGLAERIGELEGLRTRLVDREAALQESAELLASAKAGLAHADEALQQRTAQWHEARHRLTELESTTQEMQGWLEQKTGMLESSQQRLADTQAALGETARRASAQEAELSELQTALAAARKEVVRQKAKRFSRRFKRFLGLSNG